MLAGNSSEVGVLQGREYGDVELGGRARGQFIWKAFDSEAPKLRKWHLSFTLRERVHFETRRYRAALVYGRNPL